MPRPIIPDMVAKTPEVNPQIVQFLSKTNWKPKKGLDCSLRNCQVKFLDTLSPITKLYELLETAQSGETRLYYNTSFGWLQRLVCMVGNANSAMSTKRRKAILLKIEPKLASMATNEPGAAAKGLLFGKSFVKELRSFVKTFTALDKAQSFIKRVFHQKVFGVAGRGRSCLCGRNPGALTDGAAAPSTHLDQCRNVPIPLSSQLEDVLGMTPGKRPYDLCWSGQTAP
ncbi:Hypothetical predicted protein, partial [Pelobates cultripes]